LTGSAPASTPPPERHAIWRFSVAAGAIAAIAAVLVLLGWLLDIDTLKSVFDGAAAMKPNTAVCLVLLGVALVSSIGNLWNRRSRQLRAQIVRVSMVVTLAIAGLTLAEYLGFAPFDIDLWLFRDQVLQLATSYPGRISPATAFTVVMLSCAILLLDARSLFGKRLGQVLTLVSIFVPFVALLGYVYGAHGGAAHGARCRRAVRTPGARDRQ
jgi:hypothetical protein